MHKALAATAGDQLGHDAVGNAVERFCADDETLTPASSKVEGSKASGSERAPQNEVDTEAFDEETYMRNFAGQTAHFKV